MNNEFLSNDIGNLFIEKNEYISKLKSAEQHLLGSYCFIYNLFENGKISEKEWSDFVGADAIFSEFIKNKEEAKEKS